MTTGLTNSEGWNCWPAITIQRVAPPRSSPAMSTATSRNRNASQTPHMAPERMKSSGTMVAMSSMPARPTAMKMPWRTRKYVELPYSESASTEDAE